MDWKTKTIYPSAYNFIFEAGFDENMILIKVMFIKKKN